MQQLSLSVLDLVPHTGESSFEEALQQAVTLAQEAEHWGYHRYWAAEHHDMDQLSCASPEVLLARIGAATKQIRLGSGAVLLPHYSPLKVAENFRMLAALFPDRVDLGIGGAPGGSAHASMALSGNYLSHVAEMRDRVKALSELLQDAYTYEGAAVTAKPVPKIQPALWMLGTNTKSAALAAEHGTGYVFGQFMSEKDGKEILAQYRESFTASPLQPSPAAMVAVSVICAAVPGEAEALAEQAVMPGFPMEEGEKERRVITGTPDKVHSRLLLMAEYYGCSEFMIFTPPLGSYEQRLSSYRLLSQVMRQG
ncbi:MsnO8 family LLM class oxidoreductase [Paenibacillus sp. JSM ZJ436]|uniref:MsnO8 family LLM class oxidoreductase n=1 Tax=Paenibacillus sp. JSM ZJ436 TaxID=3376190 RepID=UPI0037AADB10